MFRGAATHFRGPVCASNPGDKTDACALAVDLK